MSITNELDNDYLNQSVNEQDIPYSNNFNTYANSVAIIHNTSSGSKKNVVQEAHKPKVLIMGLNKSGKSSIQKVVFHKMSPNETLFLESSNSIIKEEIQTSSFLYFTIYTLPGQIDAIYSDYGIEDLLRNCDALVFVIDAQDEYQDALNMLNMYINKAYKLNQNIKFEVFIHKVDCLSDENKIEVQRDIRQRVTDDLYEVGQIFLSFHLTSIYDHSIFEAFSKVIQKLIPQLAILENLLDIFITNSGIDKAFLFDVVSKIYVATDSSPVDMQSYELCCDMIDVVIDISGIYGVKDESDLTTFDGCSSSTIKLNNQTVLYLREVNTSLALVCILREENFDKQGLIDYNFLCFKEAIKEVFDPKNNEPNILLSESVNGSFLDEDSILNGDKED